MIKTSTNHYLLKKIIKTRKWALVVLVLGLIFANLNLALAQSTTEKNQPKLEINFFYSKTCPHCAKEKEFLNKLEQKYPEIIIKRYDIASKESIELLKNFYQEYKVPKQNWGLVPITFTGERYFLGFDNTIAKELESCIERCIVQENKDQQIKKKITLPLIGRINLEKYSLPVLAVLLGTLDGFNICSLGALVLILGLVLALRSRKKILFFGGIFVLTTAIIYGILIMLWYKLFSLLAPYVRAMEILIAVLGIGGGVYFLKQFIKYKKYGPVCEAGADQKIAAKFSSKLQESFKKPGKLFAIAGLVLLFAAVITIVEFPCSAVIPVIFAGLLSKAQLPLVTYLFYIALFIIFYLLDEIIVFLFAVFKMTVWLASGKFTTWITLAEAIALFLLGGYYLIGLL